APEAYTDVGGFQVQVCDAVMVQMLDARNNVGKEIGDRQQVRDLSNRRARQPIAALLDSTAVGIERLPRRLAGARRRCGATPAQVILQVEAEPFQQQHPIAEEAQECCGTETAFQMRAMFKGAATASRVAPERRLQNSVASLGSGPKLPPA